MPSAATSCSTETRCLQVDVTLRRHDSDCQSVIGFWRNGEIIPPGAAVRDELGSCSHRVHRVRRGTRSERVGSNQHEGQRLEAGRRNQMEGYKCLNALTLHNESYSPRTCNPRISGKVLCFALHPRLQCGLRRASRF